MKTNDKIITDWAMVRNRKTKMRLEMVKKFHKEFKIFGSTLDKNTLYDFAKLFSSWWEIVQFKTNNDFYKFLNDYNKQAEQLINILQSPTGLYSISIQPKKGETIKILNKSLLDLIRDALVKSFFIDQDNKSLRKESIFRDFILKTRVLFIYFRDNTGMNNNELYRQVIKFLSYIGIEDDVLSEEYLKKVYS